mgnify:CR=1 FL=1
MDRRIFLKRTVLLGLGGLICPKEIFSTPEVNNNTVNDKLNSDLSDKEIPSDLVKFAKEFSEKYKKLSCGTFISGCGKYRIDYVHRRKTDNKSPYGVDIRTGIMEFSKPRTVNTPPSYVFNGIIWCQVLFKIRQKNEDDYTDNYRKADLKALQCSMENGYSKKELFKQYCKVLKGSPSKQNRDRIEKLYQFIKNFKNA